MPDHSERAPDIREQTPSAKPVSGKADSAAIEAAPSVTTAEAPPGVTAIKPLRLADAAVLRSMGVFSGSLKRVQESIRQLLSQNGSGCFLVTGCMRPVLPESGDGQMEATDAAALATSTPADQSVDAAVAMEPGDTAAGDAAEPIAMTGFLALVPDAFRPEIGRLTVRATHPAFLPSLLELACRLAFGVPCFLRVETLVPAYPEPALHQYRRFGFRTDAIVPGTQLRLSNPSDLHLLSLPKTLNRFPGVGVVPYKLGLLSVTGTETQIDAIEFHVSGQPVNNPYLHDVFQMWGLLDDKSRLRPSEACVRLIRNDSLPDMVAQGVCQLEEYVQGKRQDFDLKLNLSSGSPFQQAVWAALQAIPYGTTETYLDVALKLAGGDLRKARAMSRAVGSACGANPIPVVVPCHRVIGRDGRLIGFSGGIENKEFLLEHELFRRR